MAPKADITPSAQLVAVASDNINALDSASDIDPADQKATSMRMSKKPCDSGYEEIVACRQIAKLEVAAGIAFGGARNTGKIVIDLDGTEIQRAHKSIGRLEEG